jgi:diguanylate cyclase (GGDEF)-like protein/PAS domain S-box-containing protein
MMPESAASLERIFPGESELACRLRGFDWRGVGIDAPAAWPPGLQGALGLCLASRFPVLVWYGPSHALFYNDAAAALLGGRHPAALGQPVRLAWPELWEAAGAAAEQVLRDGGGECLQDVPLHVQRALPREEVFVTLSFAPLFGDGGRAEGLCCTCLETTEKVVGRRRQRTLHALGAEAVAGRSADGACRALADILAHNPSDIRFAAVYLPDQATGTVRLTASAGADACAALPPEIAVPDGADSAGPGLLHPENALLLPLRHSATDAPSGFLLAGLAAHRPFDAAYGAFLEQVAGRFAHALAAVRLAALEAANRTLRRESEQRGAAEAALRERESRLALKLFEMRQLQRISSQLNFEDDVSVLCAQILDAAIALMEADTGSIQMVSQENKELQLLAWRGFRPESAAFWQRVDVGSNGSCGEAMRRGERVVVYDVHAAGFMAGSEDLKHFRLCDIRSMQSTPLVARSGRFVGMISTHWRGPHQPPERKLLLLDVLARQAADLLEHMKVTTALRASRAQQAFLLRLADELRVLDDSLQITSAACRLLGEHLRVQRVVYADSDGDDFIIRPGYAHGVAPLPVGRRPVASLGKSLIDRYLTVGRIVVRNVETDPVLTPEDRAAYRHAGIAAFTCARIMKSERNVGVLAIHSAAARDWPDGELELIREVADRIFGAVERSRALEGLRESERRLRSLAENSPDVIARMDCELRLRYISPAIEKLAGVPPRRLLDRDIGQFGLPPETRDRWIETMRRVFATGEQASLQFEFQDRKGIWRFLDAVIVPERGPDGRVEALLGIARDVTLLKQGEARLQFLATHDALTGLPNRALLLERLQLALARSQRGDGGTALLYVDLDHFKPVNDSLGHEIGDELLQAVASRVSECIRKTDTLARIGGDEFAVLLDDIRDPQEAGWIAGNAINALCRPFHLAGQHIYISASIGIACAPADGKTADTLLRHADAAMYKAKEDGKNGYHFFSKGMDSVARDKLFMSASLRGALERDELALVYQPCIDTRSDRIVGVEALIRWHSPARGLVLPSRFVGLAEEIGMIEPIGEWALQAACRQLVRWNTLDPTKFRVAVNISARHFRQPKLAERVARILDDTGVHPASLELEITESVVMANPEKAKQTLRQLADLGVKLALDDFGTGHSSLAYLQRFPVHRLKIDQSFVRNLPEHKESCDLARAIVAMAKSLGLEVTAEGVEREGQRLFLEQAGCENWQGYLFSVPVRADALRTMLG